VEDGVAELIKNDGIESGSPVDGGADAGVIKELDGVRFGDAGFEAFGKNGGVLAAAEKAEAEGFGRGLRSFVVGGEEQVRRAGKGNEVEIMGGPTGLQSKVPEVLAGVVEAGEELDFVGFVGSVWVGSRGESIEGVSGSVGL